MNEKICTQLVYGRAASAYPELHSLMTFLPCEYCGCWTDRIERHHRQFRSRGGLWIASNIVALCPLCHLGCTHEKPHAAEAGLNVHSWQVPALVPVKVWYSTTRVLLRDDGCYVPCKENSNDPV